MATEDLITRKPFDALADLADCYDALALLAMTEEGHASSTWILLNNLNRQLRGFLDAADSKGLLL